MPQWSGAPRRYGKQGIERVTKTVFGGGVRVLGVLVIYKSPTSAKLLRSVHVNSIFCPLFPKSGTEPM